MLSSNPVRWHIAGRFSLIVVLLFGSAALADEAAKPGEEPKPRELSGKVLRFVRSPKGPMEGLLVQHGEATFQATFPKEHAALVTGVVKPGDVVSLTAIDDESRGYWMVVKVQSLTDARGKVLVMPPKPEKPKTEDGAKEEPKVEVKGKSTTLTGEVKWLSYSKHGEVNAVVLANGDFIHLHPDGAKALGVTVGQKITATGVATTAPDGVQVLEHPETVNGKPAPHKDEDKAESPAKP
jgi:hypothetical protein